MLNRPVNTVGEPMLFRVNKNETAYVIVNHLASKKVIRSAYFLRFLIWLWGTDGDIKYGSFLLSPAESTISVYHTLLNGTGVVLQKITLKEGWTAKKMAKEFSRLFLFTTTDFLMQVHNTNALRKYGLPYTNAEGFLFPDTYFFSRDNTSTQIVQYLVDSFFRVLADMHISANTFSSKDFYDKIKLASIVEREYASPDDAPLIASVFINRLRANMKLQSCATIVYIVTEELGKGHPTRLFFSDLEYDSLYNTYLYKGLPPTPISNAGEVALRAAFFPASTDYWFFVLKGKDAKRHYFSRSGSEHLEAALKYLKDPS